MMTISGGINAARGFRAASCAAGIRYQGRDDMAMIFSETPCALAATFTSNQVKAAPVKWDQAVLRAGTPVRAVVINAGIANAATGEKGMALCAATAEHAGRTLGVDAGAVLLGSTGVIGPQLPLEKIRAERGDEFAESIYRAFIADPAYLEGAWSSIDSNPHFFEQLGISEEEIARFRAQVLE